MKIKSSQTRVPQQGGDCTWTQTGEALKLVLPKAQQDPVDTLIELTLELTNGADKP